MKRWLLIALALALVVAGPAPARAVGAFDGIYLMTGTTGAPGIAPLSLYVTVSQNGGAIAFVNLNLDGTWTYGLGWIIGSSATGTYYDHQGRSFGTFAVVLASGSFAGSVVINAIAYSVSAVKVF